MKIFDNRSGDHSARYEALAPGDAFMCQDTFGIKANTSSALVYDKKYDVWSLINMNSETIVEELNVDIYIEDWED